MSIEKLKPIFTPEEREENESRKQELTDLILSGQSLLVVGAGSSVELGYPTWKQLLKELEKVADDCGNDFNKKDLNDNEVDYLDYADEIKQYIEKKEGGLGRYYNCIYELFSKKKEPNFTEFHKNLVQLPFKGIFTTNYDRVLESALSAVEFEDQLKNDNPTKNDNAIKALLFLNPSSQPTERTVIIDKDMAKPLSDFLLSLDFKKIRQKYYQKGVAHLNGCFDHRDSIVLSRKDYIDVYNLKPEPDEKEKFAAHTGPGESTVENLAHIFPNPSWIK